MSEIRSVDLLTKTLLTILVVITSYLVLFLALTGLFVRPSSWGGMMGCMTSTSPNNVAVNLTSLSLALLAGLAVLLWLKPQTTTTNRDELEILKRALSEDEKAVLDEIGRAGEITQDSLRFRLEWSKSKVSRILSRLDKMNIIQRERTGKTYTVFLTQKKPKK